MTTKARTSKLQQLADLMGILPSYVDQSGREIKTSDETRVALLSAMRVNASSEESAEEYLAMLKSEEEPQVRVVQQQSASLDIPEGARWELELELESGETRRAEGRSAKVALSELPLGYHVARLATTRNGKQRLEEQLLIVVPPRCTSPSERLGDGGTAVGFITNLYTLRSERNWGVGDLTDLAALAKWAGDAGGGFVGLNPLHALRNRGEEVSPYSPVSRLFRNPLYLDVEAIPELREASRIEKRIEHPELQAELEQLRAQEFVEYETVMALKSPVLEELYRVFVERDVPSESARARAYDEFVRSQEPELTRFATWMALAEAGNARQEPGAEQLSGVGEWNWRNWPGPLRDSASMAVSRFQVENDERIGFHRWVQFELDRQLGAAAGAAERAGLILGLYQDLAIGSAPNGADTWAYPQLFAEGACVGAPPDPYAPHGQNWGFPPLDPHAMRRDRYRYFIRVLRSGFRHAGALRVDHIIGFFRLFWIPEGFPGEAGAYVRYPTDDLLGIIALESVRHRALVVGEDLGTVPPEVPRALDERGILSSKVLYFEREDGGFKSATHYPALALATANTHDLATLAGFWEGRDVELRRRVGLLHSDDDAAGALVEREREKRALIARLHDDGIFEREPDGNAELRGAVHEFLCRSPSVLVGLSLDDLSGEVDPVNIPGVGASAYPSWRRKMSLSLEEMPSSDAVRRSLRCGERSSNKK
jgi:4-alpha-glucanotransferase